MMFLGSTNIQECKELARLSEAEGVDAVSFTSPYYFKLANARQLALCCAEVASATPTVFYYYHIPVLTGGNYLMINLLNEVDELIPTFKGTKYTHEDFRDFLSYINFNNRKDDLLWGRDENKLSC